MAFRIGSFEASVAPARCRRYAQMQLRFEALVHRLAVFSGQRDLLGLLAQFFLDKRLRVITRRQAFDFVLAVRAGNGEEWRLHYVDVHFHPGMLVALHW